MVYAASGLPENICYATSTNATGPWNFKGVIIPTQGHSSTDHPGLIDYKGHSYFFYHNDALPGGGSYTRSVCVEEFKYNADGTFPTINMTTNGPAPIGHLNPFVRTEAETIAWESGVKTAKSDAVGVYVTDIHNGAYIKICSVDFGRKGAAKFIASVASVTNGSAIELRLDGPSGELIGTLKVKPTGALDKWKTQSCRVKGAKGVHDLYLKFNGDGSPLMNFDWWKFE
jgi:arabinoxylan arabinofuranohydrolase